MRTLWAAHPLLQQRGRMGTNAQAALRMRERLPHEWHHLIQHGKPRSELSPHPGGVGGGEGAGVEGGRVCCLCSEREDIHLYEFADMVPYHHSVHVTKKRAEPQRRSAAEQLEVVKPGKVNACGDSHVLLCAGWCPAHGRSEGDTQAAAANLSDLEGKYAPPDVQCSSADLWHKMAAEFDQNGASAREGGRTSVCLISPATDLDLGCLEDAWRSGPPTWTSPPMGPKSNMSRLPWASSKMSM